MARGCHRNTTLYVSLLGSTSGNRLSSSCKNKVVFRQYGTAAMSDLHLLKSHRREKRTGRLPSEGSHLLRTGKTKDSISTVSYLDELAHHDDGRMNLTTENTYQMGEITFTSMVDMMLHHSPQPTAHPPGPYKRIPVSAVTDILKDVLTSYLQEEKYEVEWSQKMTKTICEVIRARVKDLMIPRYKIVVLVHIGQLTGQSMQVSSRCLWDASHDTVASYSFKNSSLFGLATVYAVYYE